MTDSADNATTPTDEPRNEDLSKSTSGQSRRGKQYKCGFCHELGHNSKTCPRRLQSVDGLPPATATVHVPASSEFPHHGVSPAITPPLNATAVAAAPSPLSTFATNNVTGPSGADPVVESPSKPATHNLFPSTGSVPPPEPRPPHERIDPLPLDTALGAARQRVLDAEEKVAKATTAEEYEIATRALDESVVGLEKVVLCAQRCAIAVRTYNGV